MKMKAFVCFILACTLLFSVAAFAQETMVSELNRADSVLSAAIVLSDGSLVCLGGDTVGGPPDNSWLTRFSKAGEVMWEIAAKDDQSFEAVLFNFSDVPCFMYYDKTKGNDVLCLVNDAGVIETGIDLPRYGYGAVVNGNIWLIGYEGDEMYVSCYDKALETVWETKLTAQNETATIKEAENGAVLMMTNQAGHAMRFIEINMDGKETAHVNCKPDLVADDFIVQAESLIILAHDLNADKEYGIPYLVEVNRKTAHEQWKKKVNANPSDELYYIYPNGTGYLLAGNHFDENGVDAPTILLFTDDKGEINNSVTYPHYNLSSASAIVATAQGYVLVGTNRDAQNATGIGYTTLAR